MSDRQNALNTLLSKSVESLRSEWAALVDVACKLATDKESVEQVAHALAKAAQASEESIKRKIWAIHYMQTLSFTQEEITGMGYSQVLSKFQRSKKQEKYEKATWLKFQIPGSQREIVQQQLARVSKVCGFTSSEQLWDFLTAQLQQASDEDLLHCSGGKR